ncbi:alpha/beta hydrolase family protein [Streptomyces sp. NPDC002446]
MLDAPPAARPARLPEPLFRACGYFLPRLLFLRSRYAPQVGWGDIALALDGFPCDDLDLASAGFWDEWRRRWTAHGDRYAQLAGGSSTAAGRARAARTAAGCYHWAEFMYFDDASRKYRLRRQVRDSFLASVEGADLDFEAGELPTREAGGSPVPYWLVLPPAHRRPAGRLPCVVLSNGLDSMTEVEVLALAETYLERGIAALLFDGPGQGIQVGRTPLRIEMESVVAALVARLRTDPRIAPDRLAFFGVSFGGYLALRVARALGDAFACVVNASGGPRVAPYDGLPRRLKDDFRFAFMGGDAADMRDRVAALALDVGGPVGTDVLSVHGALDDIFPLAALQELDRAWGPRHRLRTYPGEAHVCLNEIETWSLEAADWVAGRLLPV